MQSWVPLWVNDQDNVNKNINNRIIVNVKWQDSVVEIDGPINNK